MVWPIMTDYQEAIQSPKICFGDHDLREGRLDLDHLGFPRPISGNFACVYGLAYRSSKWAIRCFLKNTQDQEKRYHSIHSYLGKVQSPYFVPFDYIRNGIRIKGAWYPILKMEWISGESLSTYVEQNLANPGAIHALSQKFLGMVKNLDDHSIAHGDLQHGNILVIGGDIKLVDYDGMYVPGLDGMPSIEIGHPNYQHPFRSEKNFGPYLDRFSEWVIYLSLKALSLNPALWVDLKGGDENLILRRADFSDPDSSEGLKVLAAQQNPELRKIADFFREISRCANLPEVPKLDSRALSDLDRRLIPAAGVQNEAAASAHPSWVLDYIEATRYEFIEEMNVERRVLMVFALALLATLVLFAVGEIDTTIFLSFLILAPLSGLSFLVLRYNQNPKVKKKQGLMAQRNQVRENLLKLANQIETAQRNLLEITHEGNETRKALNQRANRIAQMEQNEISDVDLEVKMQLQNLDDEIWQLNQAEADEFKKQLSSLQEDAIHARLSDFRLADASIPGIGIQMKKRLADAGIHTAADLVDYQTGGSTSQSQDRETTFLIVQGKGSVRVEGIGPAKAMSLLDWRKTMARQLKSDAPKAVPSEITAQIRTKFEALREELQNRILIAGPEARQKKSHIHAKYKSVLEQNRAEARRLNRYYAEKRREQEKTMPNLMQGKKELDLELTAIDEKLLAYEKINPFNFVKSIL